MSKLKWILLVEDNEKDADLAQRALAAGKAHVEIVVAHDGQEALDCLHRREEFRFRREGNPAVVLLDLKMPRVDGFEVLKQIKEDPHLKSIPVVVFTSSREEFDLAHCYDLNANAYVVKPVDFRQYLAALKEVAAFWLGINEPPPDAAALHETAPGSRRHGHWA